jgi:hypothetical protein
VALIGVRPSGIRHKKAAQLARLFAANAPAHFLPEYSSCKSVSLQRRKGLRSAAKRLKRRVDQGI